MTPSDYTAFRDSLGQSSGFQSHQYRQIAFMLGNRNRAMLRPHTHRSGILTLLEAELATPSLDDKALRHLADLPGITLPANVLKRDVAEIYQPSDEVIAAGVVFTKQREPIGPPMNLLRN